MTHKHIRGFVTVKMLLPLNFAAQMSRDKKRPTVMHNAHPLFNYIQRNQYRHIHWSMQTRGTNRHVWGVGRVSADFITSEFSALPMRTVELEETDQLEHVQTLSVLNL